MKKYRRLMTLKSDARFEEKLTLGSINDIRNWWILMQAVASLKICTLMCYFGRKYIMFEEWSKIWRGTDLCFEKWHEEFGESCFDTWKSQNFYFSGLLLSKAYNVWAKKLQSNSVSWHWRVMQYLKKN